MISRIEKLVRARLRRVIMVQMLVGLMFCGTSSAQERYFSDVPDLSQRQSPAVLPGGGEALCAPVAVSNSLVWLEGNSDQAYQLELARKLAGPEFMNTRLDSGTGVFGVLVGVSEYLRETGMAYRRLSYAGWRNVPNSFRYAMQPDLDWLLSGLHERSAVWLNLGWYFLNEDGLYQRRGGHWVTLVGYRDASLMINDPGPWADHIPGTQSVGFTTMEDGELQTRNGSRHRVSVRGFMLLNESTPVPVIGDMTIVDGAVLLELVR
ncbi:MAG: hypothetical protein V7746_02520 [Halioglobus sp.]